MTDIEKYIELLKDVGDKQVALKNRLNNLIKKCYESNPQKTFSTQGMKFLSVI